MSNKLPNGWKECKLGEVIELLYGKGLREQDRKPGNIPVYGSNGIVGYHNEYLVKGPGIIIGRKGSVGEVKYSPVDFFPIDTTYYVSLKEGMADIRFMYYFLLTLHIDEMNSHSAVPGLNRNDVYSLDVTVPPLPEQRAIASVLSSLDDKIDLLQRENKTLEAMAEALFRQWFIEEAKDDWEHTKLGEVVTITYGKNLPIKKLLRSGYPVFGGNGQIGFYNKYLYVEPQVLVSCRGEASGKVNISLPRSFITNNSLILVRDKRKEITFEYLKYHSLNYDFTLHVSGSAQPQITIDSLYDAAFLIPPVDLINKFTEIVRGYEEKRTNNLKQIHTLEKLRDTLLPKLMSGEVRVKYEEEGVASCRA